MGTVRLEIALAVPLRDGAVLVARRRSDAHQGGLWEFPGGKLETGETAAEAAARELSEETGLRAAGFRSLIKIEHDYPDRTVRLHVFLAVDCSGTLSIDGGREHAWVAPTDLAGLEMPAANRPIVEALLAALGGR
ncbi:hypothetical protein ABI59_07260 [Acidobacteria bacterium Mor1]|nr:hypothetical protein ABI59_07260 [Acidobacteria bacterium Mor1]